MTHRQPLHQLPQLERAVVLFMALLDESQSQTKWLDIIRLTGLKNTKGKALVFADIKDAMQNLLQQGWLTIAAGGSYQLDCGHDQGRLLQAFTYVLQHENVPAWLRMIRGWLEKTYGRRYYLLSRAYYRRELWLAILEGDTAQLVELEDKYMRAEQDHGRFPLTFMNDPADGTALLHLLKPACQSLVRFHSLQAAVYHMPDCPHLHADIQQQLASKQLSPDLAESYGWLLLQQGELTQLETLCSLYPAETAIFTAVLPLLQGDVTTALAQFARLGALMKKQTGKRKISFQQFNGWFYLLTLLTQQQSPDIAQIEHQLNSGRKAQDGCFYGFAGYLLKDMLAPGKPVGPELQRLFAPSYLPRRFDGLIAALLLYWLDGLPMKLVKERLIEQRNWLHDAGYLWVAAELDALLAATYQEPQLWPDWHSAAGLQPLYLLITREESWQRALHALALLNPQSSPKTSDLADTDSRVCWILQQHGYGLSIEPREQKRNSKGQWSDGRAISLKRLVREPESVAALTEQDHRVVEQSVQYSQGYYGSTYYELNPDAALTALIGHPLVFWQPSLHTPVHIKRGEFYLQLRKQGAQFKLTLQPSDVLKSQRNWLQETPTSLLVYQKADHIEKVQQILQDDGLLIPVQGKTQLLDTISALAGQLPVQSDLTELSPSIESVEPELLLYGHLLPWKSGLKVQFLVRPLADGPWFKPGKGSVQLVGEQAGKPVQTQRRLTEERRLHDDLIMACPALQEAEFDSSQWLFAEPEPCLALLEQLQQIPTSQLSLVWPEGERFRIRRQARLQDLQLNIRQQAQWLHLEGELALDQDKVLTLKELLNLVSSTKGRFIALGEQDYLALTDSFRQQLAELAQLPGKPSAAGLQLSPLTAPLLADLAAGAGQVSSNKSWQNQVATLKTLETFQPELPATLQAELRDYQLQGYQWLARLAQWGVGACLADDMGLGKTVQTLALLLQRASAGPALVVAPLSVANNWRSEAARFAPTLQVRWYHEQRDLSNLGPFDLVICSYGLLQGDSELLIAQHWHTLVLDEAQAIKNASTKRAKAAMALQADFRLAVTGTPVENHLGELWSLFQFLNPGLLGSKEQFSQRFSTPIEQGDVTARQLLKKLLQPFVLRRTKTQVLRELPARTEIQLDVELSDEERHWYEALRQQSLEKLSQLKEGQAVQVLAEITRLRRFCCHPSLTLPEQALTGSKLAVFAETLTELLENKHKVLVFSQFVDHLAIVRAYLDQQQIAYQYLDGATSVNERNQRVTAFQSGIGDVFLISLKAGGSGLNLTAADYVIHLDPWWNPAVEDQASDRAHRIGQTRPVTIYRLVTLNTIEQKILGLHAQKRELADSLLEGGDIAARLDTAQLLQLMRSGDETSRPQ